jgi:putative endonuclease
MATHNDLGNWGEGVALAHLESKGYEILQTNWRIGKLELDIIAKNEHWLIIIEVKTRTNDFFELPEEAITLKKIKNIVRATHAYIHQIDWQGETRFDVISVIPHGDSFLLEHIEDAFLVPVN